MKIATIVMALALCAPAASAQDIYFQDFENGAGGWMTSGIWGIDNSPSSHSPTKSLNVNNGVDYSSATNTVTAASPIIALGGYTSVTVSFKCNFDTEVERPGQENQKDLRTFVIGSGMTTVGYYQFLHPQGPNAPYFSTATTVVCDQPGTWHSHNFTVTIPPGESSIDLSYFFWTQDGLHNNHKGWFIDDVKITGPLGDTSSGTPANGNYWHGEQVHGPDYGSGEGGSSACGMVGWEGAFAVLALYGLRRRRR